MTQLFVPGTFRLDRMRNASAQVFDHLRERIISLNLKPGTQLQRDELAAYFDLSSTPIRDALMRLGKEGLVDIVPKQTTMVRGIDVDLARQAQFLRLSIELEIVHMLAQQPDRALVATLEGLVSQQTAAHARHDYDGFARADMAFHQQMYAAVQAEKLWEWMRQQSGHLDRLRRLHVPLTGKVKSVLADHARIVGAIAKGDGKSAQQCVRDHLSGTLAQLETIRGEHPEYF